MEAKISVGMYVRTLHNGIVKILEIDPDNRYWDKYRIDKLDVFLKGYAWIRKQDIIGEPSYDILDLIELGDYVNGLEVVGKDSDGRLYLHNLVWNTYERMYQQKMIEGKDIKSIVTKEQFEEYSYKIGE